MSFESEQEAIVWFEIRASTTLLERGRDKEGPGQAWPKDWPNINLHLACALGGLVTSRQPLSHLKNAEALLEACEHPFLVG
jgi:hypothetical protein